MDDIQIDKHVNPKVIFLRIKCSKTDPFRQGHTIRLGVSGTEICAVAAPAGRRAGPLFRHRNGQPLTRPTLTAWLKNAAARAGLEGNLSGHNFGIEATTSAAAGDKTLGRWFSNAYQLYIRTPCHILETVPARLVGDKVT